MTEISAAVLPEADSHMRPKMTNLTPEVWWECRVAAARLMLRAAGARLPREIQYCDVLTVSLGMRR